MKCHFIFENAQSFNFIMKYSYFHATSHLPLIYKTVGEQLRITAERFPDKTAVKLKKI